MPFYRCITQAQQDSKLMQKIASGLRFCLPALAFLICEATAASAVSLTNRRTVNQFGGTSFQTSADLQIDQASNIYVVDGINNTLEVFDTSIWFLPTPNGPTLKPAQGLSSSEVPGKVYFLDGINNTLQVIDTRSGFVPGSTPETKQPVQTAASHLGKTYFVDDFNQSIQRSLDTPGIVSTSGRRNGLVTPPVLASENLYIADGFNNTLQLSASVDTPNELGQIGQIEGSALTLLANFFQGNSGSPDIAIEELAPQIAQVANGGLLSGQLSEQTAQSLFAAIAQGPFAAEGVSVEAIIDSIGNPDRQLGWIKSLTAEEDLTEGTKTFDLQRNVTTGDWEIGSAVQVAADDNEDIYLVDGFNSRLQVIRSSDGTLFTEGGSDQNSPGNFYWVDGINNAIEVNDAPDNVKVLFEGRDSANSSRLSEPSTLSALVRSLTLTAEADKEYFQINGINNTLELFSQSGEQIALSQSAAELGRGVALDGQGNVYVLNGINNRVRTLTKVSVPEKGSVLGLLILVGLLHPLRRYKPMLQN